MLPGASQTSGRRRKPDPVKIVRCAQAKILDIILTRARTTFGNCPDSHFPALKITLSWTLTGRKLLL